MQMFSLSYSLCLSAEMSQKGFIQGGVKLTLICSESVMNVVKIASN